MNTIYIVFFHKSLNEWVVDGEIGRETYPATMTEEEVRTAYQNAKPWWARRCDP